MQGKVMLAVRPVMGDNAVRVTGTDNAGNRTTDCPLKRAMVAAAELGFDGGWFRMSGSGGSRWVLQPAQSVVIILGHVPPGDWPGK
ncbi:hypothetical protein GCM10011317_36320 [Niveispirillum cyanobacteriorum]|nr:hypothetical protein GCM10011317_36320 [Niveispirillum cyanobacteriorum]